VRIGARISSKADRCAVLSALRCMQFRIPSLDGLRALSVSMAVYAHMFLQVHAHILGLFGVKVFFVISGYLISGLLLEEWKTSHQIGLAGF
jgi:peptidoglycan/LPS O-acetylase OafA/YrhL